MKRPLTEKEKLLAISLLHSDLEHSDQWAKAMCVDSKNAFALLLDARRVFKGMLIGMGLNPECPKVDCPCLAERHQALPSQSIAQEPDGCRYSLQCHSELKEPQTAEHHLDNEQGDAEQFRRILVLACRA
jgi:hypothetical protein